MLAHREGSGTKQRRQGMPHRQVREELLRGDAGEHEGRADQLAKDDVLSPHGDLRGAAARPKRRRMSPRVLSVTEEEDEAAG